MVKVLVGSLFGSVLISCLFLMLACSKASASVCTDLKKSDCEVARNCSWVKGYDDAQGQRVKGYCRRKASQSADSKKEGETILDMLQDILSPEK